MRAPTREMPEAVRSEAEPATEAAMDAHLTPYWAVSRPDEASPVEEAHAEEPVQRSPVEAAPDMDVMDERPAHVEARRGAAQVAAIEPDGLPADHRLLLPGPDRPTTTLLAAVAIEVSIS